MKKYKIILLVLTVFVTSFSACKKGEDDPSISLRSRKSRVVGEWKMTNIKKTNTFSSDLYKYTSTMTGNGSTYTSTFVIVGISPSTTTGTLTWEWTFEKDGKYKNTKIEDGDISSSAGTWNFTAGIGDLKDKSQITYYEQTTTSQTSTLPATTETSTGNYVDHVYDLKELRNKKMVWYQKTTSSSSGSSSSSETEITFEAK